MNSVFCQISGMLRTIGSCQSAVLLATIAVVRYFKVVRPRTFDKIFTLKKTLMYCSFIFGGTFLLALLPVVGLGKYRFSKSHGACFVNWDRINLAFRSIYYLFNVGITFPVLIFCYLKIFQKLREHSRAVTPRIKRKARSAVARPKIEISAVTVGNDPLRMGSLENIEDSVEARNSLAVRQATALSRPVKSGSSFNSDAVKLENECAGKKKHKLRVKVPSRWFRMKREKSDVELEVTRVMFAIVVAYVCCWMPAFLVNILSLSKVVAVPQDIKLLIVTLVDLKVCLNPLIYGIGSKQFRNAFLAVLRRRRERDSGSTMSQSGSSRFVQESPVRNSSPENLKNADAADVTHTDTHYA